MAEAQRQLEEKRAYNRLVSARARQKTKQTITSLEMTVETQSKRLQELEQMRSILSEQVRHIATEKWKIEQAILQAINQDRQGGSARKGPPIVDGLLPGAASAGNASFATSLDANDLLMAVLGEKDLGADSQRRTSSATNPPLMIGSPQVSRLALARATAGTQQQQLVAASLNDLLLLNNNNNNATSVHSAVPHPPTMSPRGPTAMLHAGTQAVQPAGLSPRDQVELAAILQLLQMNRMGRSMNG